MIQISKKFDWEMGHRLSNHDSKCRNPHGHHYEMVLHISGQINIKQDSQKLGMILDFGDIKSLVRMVIIDKFDHSFMYWNKDKIMSSFATKNKDLKMVRVPFSPTAENIATFFASELIKKFENNFPEIILEKLEIYETPTSAATWVRTND